MANTGIIQRRDTKLNLLANPPLIGEIVFALDTEEFGSTIGGTLIWRSFEDIIKSVNGKVGSVVLTSDDILEGLNLYFTDTRAVNAIGGIKDDTSVGVPYLWSSQKIIDTVKNSNIAYSSNSNPTNTDDTNSGFHKGSIWMNISLDAVYICLDETADSAIWKRFIFIDDDISGGTY